MRSRAFAPSGTQVQLDVWSKRASQTHCKDICHLVKRCLGDQGLALGTSAFITGTLVLDRVLPDPEEGTTHGVLQFEFELEDLT